MQPIKRLRDSFFGQKLRKSNTPGKKSAPRTQLSLMQLEDRTVPSTVSSITGSFNGTKIPAGDTLWFNSALSVSGLPKATPATLHVVNETIDFTAGGTAYHLAVPNAVIVFTPGQNTAATTFDPI